MNDFLRGNEVIAANALRVSEACRERAEVFGTDAGIERCAQNDINIFPVLSITNRFDRRTGRKCPALVTKRDVCKTF